MSWTSGCFLALAALTLGRALQVNNGFFHPDAFRWLMAALGLAIAGVAAGRLRGRMEAASRRALPGLLLAGVLLQALQLFVSPPLMYAPLPSAQRSPFLAQTIAASALLAIVVAFASKRVRIAAFAALVCAHTAMGVWAVRTVPNPAIDVVTVHREAIAALKGGRSPYSITFADIYGGESGFYAQGMSSGGRVQFGYPYPPLSLLLAAPAEWAFGDFRYAEVAALSVAAALVGAIGWTPQAMLAGALLLTTPRVLFEIEQGWTEPFAVMLLAAAVAALSRGRAASAPLLGLTMAVKQYLGAALLLVPLLPVSAAPVRKTAVVAVTVAAAVTLPFLLWDPRGFLNSVVLLQFREPFRADSLSVPAWLASRGYAPPGMWVTAVAAAIAAVVSLGALPRTPASSAAGLALVTFAAFAFGKKAFCNYYFFVLGALAAAIAGAGTHMPGTGADVDGGNRQAESEPDGRART
jgi:hypothetical protein